jgi:GNAT superfamily N-acetyltransferase
VTTGGWGRYKKKASSLFVVRERGGEGQEVAKALLTYANYQMERIGPTLELIEVKGSWRGRGLGRRLLQVIDRSGVIC